MNRTSVVNALVLSQKQVGESNRLVTLFTKEDGITSAMLYGGPKSRLRALVSPYHTGRMWLYRDTVRNTVKINDFDVTSFRPALRENLYKMWAASLCAELLIKTCARGDSLFTLANAFLDGLDFSAEDECKLGTIRFLWRMQSELGTQCDTSRCVHCDAPLLDSLPVSFTNSAHTNSDSITENESFGTDNNRFVAHYAESENGFLCPACLNLYRLHSFTAPPPVKEAQRSETLFFDSSNGVISNGVDSNATASPLHYTRGCKTEAVFPLTGEALRYLQAISTLPPKEVRRLRITGSTFGALWELLFFLSEKSCDGKIKTLENTRYIW